MQAAVSGRTICITLKTRKDNEVKLKTAGPYQDKPEKSQLKRRQTPN